VPTVTVDGIRTRYEVRGSGPPLLMFSPGGFDAVLENWSTHGVYRRTGLLDRLVEQHTCVLFDRREAGGSGGRVERVTWRDYAEQGKGLLDHLGIERAALVGGCVGCSAAAAFAVRYPQATAAMVLFSPAGGARYRMLQHARFGAHLAFAAECGPVAVAAVARSTTAGFAADPRIGPWGSLLRTDDAFAAGFARLDGERYQGIVASLVATMFDRDSVPGPEPAELLMLDVPALVVPGQDASHATSAARFLQECLPAAQYWDAPVAEQTPQTAPARVLEFLITALSSARAGQ
jgi:pimeloyl-ACP methyl ester carboxylesterase